MDLLKEVSKDRLVIMVTHNKDLALQYSTRIIRLKDGRIEGDTNPCSDEECARMQTVEDTKKLKKPSMGLPTALSLSLKNLMTKKGRTILISIAGSIGIVGIALILSLSNGVQKYINDMQKNELFGEPISMEKMYVDLEADTTYEESNVNLSEIKNSRIITTDDISSAYFFSQQSITYENNLKKFKEYIEAEKDKFDEYADYIQYGYSVDLQIYAKDDNDKINKISISEDEDVSENEIEDTALLKNAFSELSDEKVLEEQYEIVDGRFPEDYNEMVLVVDEDRQIPLSVVYSLGLKDRNELTEIMLETVAGETPDISTPTYDYDEIIGRKYKLILNSDCYVKEDGIWTDKTSDYEYLSRLYDEGTDLEVVGIIKAKKDLKSQPATGFMGYTNKLTEYVISNISEKEITKEQLADKTVNVLTGEKFDAMNDSYEDNLELLGIADLENPDVINIYPKDYEAKNELKKIIDEYNEAQEESDIIKYADLTELLLSGVTGVVKIVSYILIAFVAISLIVAGIMIAIITYISVLERTKEIGVLRAIGASRRDVSRVFTAETIIEGLVSGCLGIAVTFLLNIVINAVLKVTVKIEGLASLPVVGAAILVIISALLTVLAGHIPSKMASKKDPVEALRDI